MADYIDEIQDSVPRSTRFFRAYDETRLPTNSSLQITTVTDDKVDFLYNGQLNEDSDTDRNLFFVSNTKVYSLEGQEFDLPDQKRTVGIFGDTRRMPTDYNQRTTRTEFLNFFPGYFTDGGTEPTDSSFILESSDFERLLNKLTDSISSVIDYGAISIQSTENAVPEEVKNSDTVFTKFKKFNKNEAGAITVSFTGTGPS
jgi:hypothetical protein